MRFDPVLASPRRERMRERGLWSDRTLHDHFLAALNAFPDKVVVVDHGQARVEPLRLSYRQLDDRVRRIAASLLRLGVERGDVVSVQLHNCWQHIALALACARTGAVINPLMPIFRERELEFMLNLCESKLMVIPDIWRGRDHVGMVRALLPKLPYLRHLVVLGDTPGADFDTTLLGEAPCPAARPVPLHSDDVAMVMFTSGTTGQPKGVMHTSNTLLATLDAVMDSLQMTPDDVALCSAPMGHLLGFALLGLFPLMFKGTTVIIEAWDIDKVMRLVNEEHITFMAGPTPHLADMCQSAATGAAAPAHMRVFCCAGAPIPPVLIDRADRQLNMTVCSLWGMTEVQAGTVTEVGQARDFSALADGRPPKGMETKVVDDAGRELPIGQTGRFLVRGSGVFAGYLKHPELNDVNLDGWFDTGDLAFVVNDQGYVRLNGRSKDIIKRGGESVPVVEVEGLLAAHPSIAGVAIVGWPDERFGELVCAFIQLHAGAGFDLAGMREYLRSCRLTPQYWPERIEFVDALPRTPSGKVQKFRLREIAAARQTAALPGPLS